MMTNIYRLEYDRQHEDRRKKLKRKITVYILALLAFILLLTASARAEEEIIAVIYTDSYLEQKAAALEPKIYVPDSDDDCPISELVPISEELQEYIWTKVKRTDLDPYEYYCFMLAIMQHESSFRERAFHENSNGTSDRGICQINSSNIKKLKAAGLIGKTEDLYDPYKSIDCAFFILDEYIEEFGVVEAAYYAYNTGRKKQGSNKGSRAVMGYYESWRKALHSAPDIEGR